MQKFRVEVAKQGRDTSRLVFR